MNVAWHELMNGSSLMIDPNLDVNEVCAIILAGKKNGCVILGGGSPKNFYLQGQPTLWEVYGIPKGGNEFFIQITTDQVVWGGLSGATPSEAVSWGKVNPGVLPDTVVAYCDSTIALSAVLRVRVSAASTASASGRGCTISARALVADLRRQGRRACTPTAKRARRSGETKASAMPRPMKRGRRARETRSSLRRRSAARLRRRESPAPASSSAMRHELGWDVLFVLEEPELRRASDRDHFGRALELGRTLITLDHDFFDDRRFPPH